MCLLVKYNALELLVSPSSVELFQDNGELKKKKFTDHVTANTIPLLAATNGKFSDLFFSWKSFSKGKFSKDYLINVATVNLHIIKIDIT